MRTGPPLYTGISRQPLPLVFDWEGALGEMIRESEDLPCMPAEIVYQASGKFFLSEVSQGFRIKRESWTVVATAQDFFMLDLAQDITPV
jgi:hypothetical protein